MMILHTNPVDHHSNNEMNFESTDRQSGVLVGMTIHYGVWRFKTLPDTTDHTWFLADDFGDIKERFVGDARKLPQEFRDVLNGELTYNIMSDL